MSRFRERRTSDQRILKTMEIEDEEEELRTGREIEDGGGHTFTDLFYF